MNPREMDSGDDRVPFYIAPLRISRNEAAKPALEIQTDVGLSTSISQHSLRSSQNDGEGPKALIPNSNNDSYPKSNNDTNEQSAEDFLVAMGFTANETRHSLQSSNGDLHAALALLLDPHGKHTAKGDNGFDIVTPTSTVASSSHTSPSNASSTTPYSLYTSPEYASSTTASSAYTSPVKHPDNLDGRLEKRAGRELSICKNPAVLERAKAERESSAGLPPPEYSHDEREESSDGHPAIHKGHGHQESALPMHPAFVKNIRASRPAAINTSRTSFPPEKSAPAQEIDDSEDAAPPKYMASGVTVSDRKKPYPMEKGGGPKYPEDDHKHSPLPPAYSESTFITNPTATELSSLSDTSISENVEITGDGRFDLQISTGLARNMSRLTPRLHNSASTSSPPAYNDAEVSAWSLPLNICIQVVGTRGDVQPFVTLANELQTHGHRVRLATHATFVDFVTSAGVEFYPIGGDPATLMANTVENPNIIPSMATLRSGQTGKKREMIKEILDGAWQSCISPDPITGRPFVAEAIIANPVSVAHVHCAQALGIPVHLMFTMPWSATRAFPHPLANLKVSNSLDTELVNFLSYGMVDYMTFCGLSDMINTWRNKLGLEEVAQSVGPFLPELLKVPFIYCWSPALVAKPFDWPEHVDVCGFFFREQPKYEPPEDLRAWLAMGKKPIYIGFGSIVLDDPESITQTVLGAVEMSGERAIVGRGGSNIGGPENTDQVFYLDDCPHEWLFQQVSVVVHHGGADVTACGLLNGCPTTIVPFVGDQPFWGNTVAKAGAGPRPIPQKALNVDNLTAAIEFCLTPEAVRAAKSLSEDMRHENSVKTAVASFHRNLPPGLGCEVMPEHSATWLYEDKQCMIRLSAVASALLLDMGTIETKMLKLLHTKEFDTTNKRWDPETGMLSNFTGGQYDALTGAAEIVYKPYTEYKKEKMRVATAQSSGEMERIHTGKLAANMAGASAKSMGKLTTQMYKSMLVDAPLAFADGLHNAPMLYGDTVKDCGKVTDWKSGFKVAGKSFAYGFTGFSDLVVKPYQGAKQEGALGAAKGIGKGFLNMGVKFSSGVVGTVAYSGSGIIKSLHTSTPKDGNKTVRLAKEEEGRWEFENSGFEGDQIRRVMQAFHRVRGEKIERAQEGMSRPAIRRIESDDSVDSYLKS